MTPVAGRADERRRYERRAVVASAAVLTDTKYVGTYLVENLSAGGALLVGDARLEVGERVQVLLHLPGKEPVHLVAKIVRQQVNGAAEHRFAVAFHELSSAIGNQHQQVVLATLNRPPDTTPSEVLVGDNSREVCATPGAKSVSSDTASQG